MGLPKTQNKKSTKQQFILHLDLHFRNQSDGDFFYFTDCFDDLDYIDIVQDTQYNLTREDMLEQTKMYLDKIVQNQSTQKLRGLIINPNFSYDNNSHDCSGFRFINQVIRGLDKVLGYDGYFSQTPILIYSDCTFNRIKIEVENDVNSSKFNREMSNLNWQEKPKLNSYMRVQEQSQEGLQNWLNYIKSL
jgi:hypothetical protein